MEILTCQLNSHARQLYWTQAKGIVYLCSQSPIAYALRPKNRVRVEQRSELDYWIARSSQWQREQVCMMR